MLRVCDTKRLYDTEFEATVAAAKDARSYGEEMMPYRCGSHWHLTHVQRKARTGTGKNHARCPHCKQIFKRGRKYGRHMLSCAQRPPVAVSGV